MRRKKKGKIMNTQLLWFLIVGLVILAAILRCVAKFNCVSNHYGVIGFDSQEDAFEYNDDDNDDECDN